MAKPDPNNTLAHLLEPDALLPSQFYGTHLRRIERQPERRLALAVLQNAVECFQNYMHRRDPKARRLYLDAKAWIFSTDRTWPFSFNNLCDALQIEPEYLRRGVRQWERQDLPADCPIPSSTAR